MIDKLELRTDYMKPEAIKTLGSKYDHFMVGDKNYRECHVFKSDKNHIITVKTNPVFPNASFCSIELNPSKFKSVKDMTALISLISDEGLFIKRIDFAVDVPIPIEEIRKAIKAKHKRLRHDYKENDICTGFELGSDQEIICIYDKAYELLKRRKYRKLEGQIPKLMTRIELRLRAKKIPFKSFDELQNYLDINPFKIIEFYKLDNLEGFSDFQLFQVNKLLITVNESGCLHGAIKRLNQNNNFKRDHKYLIRNTDLENHIADQFKSNLYAFLGGRHG
jgi:hypothetical protein